MVVVVLEVPLRLVVAPVDLPTMDAPNSIVCPSLDRPFRFFAQKQNRSLCLET
jgi:hypothetical protein